VRHHAPARVIDLTAIPRRGAARWWPAELCRWALTRLDRIVLIVGLTSIGLAVLDVWLSR
jgi:hypothetical protein